MPQVPVTIRVTVKTDDSVRELKKVCEDIAEIIELVPEWNMNECDQISDRILNRLKNLLAIKQS